MKAVEAKAIDELLDTGSIIHWPETSVGKVPVTCGGYKVKRDVSVTNIQRELFTGFCYKCRNKRTALSQRKTKTEQHSSGALVLWAVRDTNDYSRVAFICRNCQRQSFVLTHQPLKTSWAGLCSTCLQLPGMRVRRTLDERHPTGAVIHWGERDLSNVDKVAFTCAGCERKRFTVGARVKLSTWTGLCNDCFRSQPHPNKRTQREQLASGSIIQWGERDPGKEFRVKVTCGLCKKERFTHVPRAPKKREKWTGYCSEHFNNPADLLARLNKHSLGVEPQNKTLVKRQRGRQEGTTYVDRDAFLISLKDAIRNLCKQTASINEITYDAVARVFQTKGETIGGDAVRKRFNECKSGLKWRDFIVTVTSQNGN